MAILEIKNLRVDYQTDDALVHALNDVNLKMEKGKTLGLVGETGAGKTTLAKCIMGILPQRTGRIRSGEIFYEDKDLLKTEGKGQILRSTPNTAPLICGACNTQPEGLSTMA